MLELKIKKVSDYELEFSYVKVGPTGELHEERGDVMNMLDESKNALLTRSQKMEKSRNGHAYRLKITTCGV